MILADTSIWIDHLRRGDATLADLLSRSQILGHPAIVGEIALGSLANRQEVLDLLGNLPSAVTATHDEVMSFVGTHELFGLGIGYVDAHLLAAVRLTPAAALWTRDKRLHATASRIGVDADLT